MSRETDLEEGDFLLDGLWLLGRAILKFRPRLLTLPVKGGQQVRPNIDTFVVTAAQVGLDEHLLDLFKPAELWNAVSESVESCLKLNVACLCLSDEIRRRNLFQCRFKFLAIVYVHKLSVKGVIVVKQLFLADGVLSFDNFIELCIQSQLSTCCPEDSP